MGRAAGALLALAFAPGLTAATGAPPSPAFVHTIDSDEWVTRSFHVQSRPKRVLLVAIRGERPSTIDLAPLDLNHPGHPGPDVRVRVDAVFATLQEAADAAHGGDLVAVLPGVYAGFVLRDKPDAGDGRYVCFKALGRPGEVTIDRAGPDPDWMVLFQGAHHAVLQGFEIAGHTGPGLPPIGPRAGIMIDGDFGRTGRMAHHIALVSNFSHNHRKWGFHSTDSYTVLIEDNLFALSAQEHSAYASDGSDDYVIRRNVFHGSNASGLQCNLDTVSSFHEVLKNAAFRDFPKEEPTRDWALRLVRRATELFGARNFPDGKGENFIIENNVIWGNGRAGAASLNLAGLQDSLIQNNLIYGNFNHGIAQWDDANPYDAGYVTPGPQDPADVAPDDLPLWGCARNHIRNNTVLMANPERAALQARNGSWGGKYRNNIAINDVASSIEIFNTSLLRLDSGYNVANAVVYPSTPEPLKRLALALDESNHSTLTITREQAAAEMVRYGEQPWVLIEGHWWRPNPERPDFRPRAGSRLFAGSGDPGDVPPRDLLGHPRVAADIGALAAAAPPPTVTAEKPQPTLAERLGHKRDARLVIIHTDDLGEWHAVNAAAMQAFATGLVTSGVAMAPCPWFPELAAWAKEHPEFDLGLHVTVTSERTDYRWGPVASRDRVPSLLDAGGYLEKIQIEAARRIDPREAELEATAQLERALALGLKPTHLDSHQAVLYQRADLFQALVRVSRRFGIPLGLARSHLDEHTFMAEALAPGTVVIDRAFDIPPTVPPEGWADWYDEQIRSIGPGVTQVVMHLGIADAELRAGTRDRPTWGAEWRQRDFDYFTSDRFRRLLRENGLEVVTWREIGALAGRERAEEGR
jgi:predicted glycoside hydrolase/deacetylase ChbG (UPF0249 family)